jgi:hypothetical protein
MSCGKLGKPSRTGAGAEFPFQNGQIAPSGGYTLCTLYLINSRNFTLPEDSSHALTPESLTEFSNQADRQLFLELTIPKQGQAALNFR